MNGLDVPPANGSVKVAFLVQGLFEISDSIGFDCVHQFRTVRDWGKADAVRIFAERFVAERYPDIPIESVDAFRAWCSEEPDVIVVYHFCGAWQEMDDFLLARPTPFVLRWHNNTPPWFYLNEGHNNIRHTLAGYESIRRFADDGKARVWVNSDFTRRQLVSLGGSFGDVDVVFPASRYLDAPAQDQAPGEKGTSDVFEILFTSRVVAHKGHLGVLAVAGLVQATGRRVRVRFPGRHSNFKRSIEAAAAELDVEVHLPGEVDEADLQALYRRADVFICLSEHEGFGMPIFEAMRCAVPVMAWATSAFGELLAGHPLAFAEYDLDRFAAAVLALDDPEVRRAVLDAQTGILDRYTADVVARQLDGALARAMSTEGSTFRSQDLPAALAEDPVLLEAFAVAAARIGKTPPERASIEHDSSGNLVSLYDLSAYHAYLDALKETRFAPITASRREGMRITAPEFDSRLGKVGPDAITFPKGAYNEDHLIFGPYLDVPPGDYAVRFDFEARVSSVKAFAFELDVGIASGQVAKGLVAPANMDDPQARTLHFSLPPDCGSVEFRVRPTRPFQGDVVFRGVDVMPEL